ncbi:hypothetical protein LX16_0605 [Stackebrandtia albiflava]|uniref:DUF4190 domain-containing protein n=1 Tax=Stackebrandtia albiflava TaxID=406432 RepID=A0A562VAN9_9ACTN|nr:hypothetical protein [Stackebrandtia albiflava]TWJ14911.1 hypothetical protein LX16_0605 [Stackebrandtia albiflava]
MSLGPPSEPVPEAAPPPYPAAPAPFRSGGTVPTGPPPPGYPPAAPGPFHPGGTVPTGRPGGAWPGIVAMAVGLFGCGVPFLPFDMTGFRHLIALPMGLAGLALAIFGCVGNRRGKPVAVAGIVVCLPVVALGVWWLAAWFLPGL